MDRTRRALRLTRAVVHEIRVERITFMAGSIAYHAFVSLLPLLLLLLAVVSAIGHRGIERSLIDLVRAGLTPGASEVLVSELRNTPPGVSVLGVLVLVWGTLRIFRGLDTAFSDIYESEAANTLLDQFADGLIVLLSVGVVVLLAAALESLIPSGGGTTPWLLGRVLLVVGIAAALLPMYYVFPDEEDMRVREVLPGVLFASLGLTAFESLFRLYVAASARDPSSSVLASLLVFLTWLYFSGLVLLVGVVINAVLSNRSRDVDVRPLFGVPAGAEATPDPDLDRERLVATLERLEDLLADAERVTVVVGDEEVVLPRPDRTVVDTDPSALPFLQDALGVELRWSPHDSPSGGDATTGEGATEETATGGSAPETTADADQDETS